MRHHKQSLPKENKSMTEKGKQYMKKKFSIHPRDYKFFNKDYVWTSVFIVI